MFSAEDQYSDTITTGLSLTNVKRRELTEYWQSNYDIFSEKKLCLRQRNESNFQFLNKSHVRHHSWSRNALDHYTKLMTHLSCV